MAAGDARSEDKMYRAYDGIVNGTRFVNDDN